MTYLVPDDWYANHYLAPGDARGRQPILQPRPGNEVTSAIMRGYYGRPPIAMLRFPGVALRPFADTDVIWGVNGLGGTDIAASMKRTFEKMSEKMRKEMMIRAAALTAAYTTLAVTVPVVGTIVAGIAAAVSAIAGSKYQNEAKQIIAEAQQTIQLLVSTTRQKMDAADLELTTALQPAAIELAVSGQALSGLGDFWSNAKDAVKRVVAAPANDLKHVLKKVGASSVVNAMEKVEDAGQKALDYVTGRTAVTEAREAANKAVGNARTQLDRMYADHVASLLIPEFQQNLVIQMARQARADAGFTAPSGTAQSLAKGGAMAAVGVVGAIVAFTALGGGHH